MRPESFRSADNRAAAEKPAAAVTVDRLGLAAPQAGPDILYDISVAVAPGERVGIVGPNGAGKSSLLKCLYRFQKPSRGRVLINGRDIWSQPAADVAQTVAAVLQEYPADFAFTVRQVVQMGRIPHKKGFQRNTHADVEIAREALSALGLVHLEKRAFASLSGGEKQRAMVARALVQQPRLLILDEPTNHLDIRYQLEVLSLVSRLDLTLIATIHDLNLAAAYFDRLLLMLNGAIVADGAPQDVLSSENLVEVFQVDALLDPHPLHGRPRITYRHDPSSIKEYTR